MVAATASFAGHAPSESAHLARYRGHTRAGTGRAFVASSLDTAHAIHAFLPIVASCATKRCAAHALLLRAASLTDSLFFCIGDEIMVTQEMLDEYLSEIRLQVCHRCIERPPGGPPCLPLGKRCGVELHLTEFVNTTHSTHSLSIAPYVNRLREDICAFCSNRVTNDCPCTLDYLLPLVVEAIETVDARQVEADEAFTNPAC